MNTEQFKQELRSLPIKELTDKIDYYSGFEPRGLNYTMEKQLQHQQ